MLQTAEPVWRLLQLPESFYTQR